MGHFFNHLGGWLSAHGVKVFKINLNGGDFLFHRGPNTVNYSGSVEEFPGWIGDFIQKNHIDALVCFGDCRIYHRLASRVAETSGRNFYVFEEGYLRPDYVTLEKGGVNAYSNLAAKPSDFLRHEPVISLKPEATHPSFRRMGLTAMAYYAAGWFLQYRFPHYRHHKDFSPFKECFYWVRSGIRKVVYRQSERSLQKQIIEQLDNRYFLVALQVFNDSQILEHSPYEDVRDFIEEVITSFARHAKPDHHLVLKHHPMDRGHRDYSRLIADLSGQNGVAQRVHYVHDAHLPTLLKHSLGVVTINSTVGLSALHHEKPLITLGRALYDIEGLTYQHELSSFWSEYTPVDQVIYLKLRSYMIKTTQLNGAFFGKSPWMKWPEMAQPARPRLRPAFSVLIATGLAGAIPLATTFEELLAEFLPWGSSLLSWLAVAN